MSGPLHILVLEDEDTDFRLLCRLLDSGGLSYRAQRVANAAGLSSALHEPAWEQCH